MKLRTSVSAMAAKLGMGASGGEVSGTLLARQYRQRNESNLCGGRDLILEWDHNIILYGDHDIILKWGRDIAYVGAKPVTGTPGASCLKS